MKLKLVILLTTSLFTLPSIACFHQGYTCFERCSQLPIWEIPFCDLGAQRKTDKTPKAFDLKQSNSDHGSKFNNYHK
ncbi:hypothetical protein R1B80_23190 [Escherichia coli]|nr:hypothetical protein [Escherichia coli]